MLLVFAYFICRCSLHVVDHTLVLDDLVQGLVLEGHLGGRSSSFGDSEGRVSKLEVSRSRKSMSFTSPSLEDAVSWVLEVETSTSLPLTGLPAPSFLAAELEGEGRETPGLSQVQGGVSHTDGVTFLSPDTSEVPSCSAPVLTTYLGRRTKSMTLSHAAEEKEESLLIRNCPFSSLSRRHLGR